MLVFRVGRTQYADDLEGSGAKLFGGRWNHIGTCCLYTSSTRALAILEYSVNINIEFIPRALSISTFEIKDKLIKKIDIKDLPGNWKKTPAPASTKDFGTELLQNLTPIIQIPSSIIEEEYNYLINPLAKDKDAIKLIEIKDCVYDVRIKI